MTIDNVRSIFYGDTNPISPSNQLTDAELLQTIAWNANHAALGLFGAPTLMSWVEAECYHVMTVNGHNPADEHAEKLAALLTTGLENYTYTPINEGQVSLGFQFDLRT